MNGKKKLIALLSISIIGGQLLLSSGRVYAEERSIYDVNMSTLGSDKKDKITDKDFIVNSPELINNIEIGKKYTKSNVKLHFILSNKFTADDIKVELLAHKKGTISDVYYDMNAKYNIVKSIDDDNNLWELSYDEEKINTESLIQKYDEFSVIVKSFDGNNEITIESQQIIDI